jgi:hypothetical protein
LAAASGAPYTPLTVVLAVAGGLPDVLAVAVVGDVVDARIDGGARPHADTNETLATPMQAPTRALRTALVIRDFNIFVARTSRRFDLVYKLAPAGISP